MTKKADVFLKKYLNEVVEETPSNDFSMSVMNQIQQLKPFTKITKQEALISNKQWFFVGFTFFALCIYSLKFGDSESLFELEVNWSFLDTIKFEGYSFEPLQVSQDVYVIIYALVIVFVVQFFLLKMYLEKRIRY